MDLQQVGGYTFIVGVLLAILAGAFGGYMAAYLPWITFLLVILGLVVGLLNIADKEIKPFLVAAIALMVMGTAQLGQIDMIIPMLGSVLDGIVRMVAVFVAPAALVVALKAVYGIASVPTKLNV